jgi:integrase
MGRRVRDTNLESRDARSKLKRQGKPYWRAIGKGLHVGYRKNRPGYSVWTGRRRRDDGGYETFEIGLADDVVDANGDSVLDFWQAQEVARTTVPKKRNDTSAYLVKHAIDDYVTHLGDRQSAKGVRYRLAAYCEPLMLRPVASLTTEELERWHRNMAKAPPRGRTSKGGKQQYLTIDGEEGQRKRMVSANKVRDMLAACLNFAFSRGRVHDQSAWKRLKPFKGVAIPRSRYLTIAECQRLLNACDPDFRILVRAGLETGMRVGELRRLTVKDFNPAAGTIHVRKTKTGRDRHVILTDDAVAFFGQLATGRKGSDLLLNREWKSNQHERLIREACIRANIDPRIVFHELRHTYASLCVMAAVPLMVLARNLGHTDTRQVEKTYGHLAPGYVADEIRKGAPRFGPVDPTNVESLK